MNLRVIGILSVAATISLFGRSVRADDAADVRAALQTATSFYHDNCAKHGGYVWRYSNDLTLSEGEAETGPDTVWVQPPGTPAVGMALIEAFDASGDRRYLDWAKEAAQTLIKGQLQSGGWYYSIQFDPAERAKWGYKDNPSFRPSTSKKNKTNITTLDDDTTTAAIRLLMRVDRRLNFEDASIHEAATSGLATLLAAQRPNGGWEQNWDNYPAGFSTREFPVVKASYPEQWSRKWLNDWPGHYYLNDDVTKRVIETILEAYRTYDDPRYLDAATRAGDFLILAQMPEPQPAWAQQYDVDLQPCWDRKF